MVQDNNIVWNAARSYAKAGIYVNPVYVTRETPAMMAMRERKEGEAAAIAEARRWLYTAVTRARESVTLARLRGQ